LEFGDFNQAITGPGASMYHIAGSCRPGKATKAKARPLKKRAPPRLTAHAIIIRCRAGAHLCKSYGRRGVMFTLQPPGVHIKPRYARKAIASEKLSPSRDGLFSNETQTWVARKEAQ
jgi:hypothetical protein